MSQLTEMLYRSFPDSSQEMPKNLKPYHQFRHDLHVVNGVPCYKDKVIIPEKLRAQVVDSVHAAHQGVSGMLSRVENSIFWPGITTDIVYDMYQRSTNSTSQQTCCSTIPILSLPVCSGGLLQCGRTQFSRDWRQILMMAQYL